MTIANDEILIGKHIVFGMVGLSDTTIWRLEKKGEFPKRKQLSKNRVAWLKKDIVNWIQSRQEAI